MTKKTEEQPTWRPCEVSWTDAQGVGGWHHHEVAASSKPLVVKSIGYMVTNSRKHIVIAQSMDGFDGVGDFLVIPRACLVKVHYFDDSLSTDTV